jgi:catechol 2,3-dioxygenase-like lactoylglutathione lyase family enzyme
METHPVQWAGRNHLALITDNLERTTRFWHGVLGAPLVATLGTEAFQHYFFDVGHGATVAFFAYRGHQVDHFAKPAGVPDARAMQFDHVAPNLPNEAALHRLLQRLLEHSCEVTEMVDHGLIQSIYFTDPMAASWRPRAGRTTLQASPLPPIPPALVIPILCRRSGSCSRPGYSGPCREPRWSMPLRVTCIRWCVVRSTSFQSRYFNIIGNCIEHTNPKFGTSSI